MAKLTHILSIAVCCSLFAGCSVTVPGKTYGDTAPKLVKLRNDKLAWQHAGNFGPVPSDKYYEGKRLCQGIDANRAVGYHPKARNLKGQTYAGGGYFCVR